jgi:hypothetical protein
MLGEKPDSVKKQKADHIQRHVGFYLTFFFFGFERLEQFKPRRGRQISPSFYPFANRPLKFTFYFRFFVGRKPERLDLL